MVLVTSWFQISSLHNCETANFCCFKLTVCGKVLQHSWETNALPSPHTHTLYTAQCLSEHYYYRQKCVESRVWE